MYNLYSEHLLLQVQIVEIIFRIYIRWATVITKRKIASPFDQGNKTFHIELDRFFSLQHLEFVEASHYPEVLAILLQEH